MKKTVVTFGLIAGAIFTVMMLATIPLVDKVSFNGLTVIGYTTMVVAFLMVFFGIRSYRENVGGGVITFGKALQVGFLIMLIACACYVIAGEIIYTHFMPDFIDKYGNYLMEETRAAGASPETLAAKQQEIASFKAMYRNPLIRVAFILLEPLPVGIPLTLISAAILRKKETKRHSTESLAA